MAFEPTFSLTPETAKALMAIEASRAAVDRLPISPQLIASLRESARLHSTHYSTQIEGNRLTLPEVEQVIAGKGGFPGRERDEREVQNYYKAVEKAESLAALKRPLKEEDLQLLHGLSYEGRAKPTPYRDGQNVIRNSGDGSMVYMPPEATEVPALMGEFVSWINHEIEEKRLPVPVIAALAHYQFATIHPYYDGNGRTARLLTTLILHSSGYGLKGIYSLEEYYAKNLPAYYAALTVGPSHNYHMGRAEADITGFIEYFCRGMADTFSAVRVQAMRAADRGAKDVSMVLRRLDPRQRRVLELFQDRASVTAAEIAAHLSLQHRTVVVLCRTWVKDGFLRLVNASRKNRLYGLAEEIEKEVGGG